MDEHLLIDFPTVVSAVLLLSGARQLHWVGHSMGGMLAVGAQSRGLECAAALRSITLLASGCFGAGSWHSLVGPFVRRITAAGFHAGQIVPFAAALRGPLAPLAWGVRALFYVRGNVEPRVARKLLGSFLSFIPSGVVAQFMVRSSQGPRAAGDRVCVWGGGQIARLGQPGGSGSRAVLFAGPSPARAPCSCPCRPPSRAPLRRPGPPSAPQGSLNSDLGISSADGSWNYADPKVLAHVTTPIMAVNGSRDLFCPAAGGARALLSFRFCAKACWSRRVGEGRRRRRAGAAGRLPASGQRGQGSGGGARRRGGCAGPSARPQQPGPSGPETQPTRAPPPAGLKTVNLFGGPHRRFLFLGPDYGGSPLPCARLAWPLS